MAAKNRFNHIDCLGAALPDEEYFVLLARDPAFPALLGLWASIRVGNLQAAVENFTLLSSFDLIRHYQAHPDIAKSQEAIATAQRGADWRQANLNGPGGQPTWKQSLVRPQMLDLQDASPGDATAKVACGLRQLASDMQQWASSRTDNPELTESGRRVLSFVDRANGYAAELEAEAAPLTGENLQYRLADFPAGDKLPDEETKGDMS